MLTKFKKGADDQTLHDVMKIDYTHIFIHFSKLHTSKPPQISFTSFPTVFLLRNNTLAIFLLSRLLVLIYFISLNLIHSKYQYVKTTSNIICITFSFIFIKKPYNFSSIATHSNTKPFVDCKFNLNNQVSLSPSKVQTQNGKCSSNKYMRQNSVHAETRRVAKQPLYK